MSIVGCELREMGLVMRGQESLGRDGGGGGADGGHGPGADGWESRPQGCNFTLRNRVSVRVKMIWLEFAEIVVTTARVLISRQRVLHLRCHLVDLYLAFRILFPRRLFSDRQLAFVVLASTYQRYSL